MTEVQRPATRVDSAPRAAFAQSRLASIIDRGSELVIVTDSDANLIYASSAGQDLLGYHPRELLGICVLTLLHPDDLSEAAAALVSTAETGGIKEPFEARVAHANGGWVRFEVIATNLLDDPSVSGLVFHCRALTDRDQITHRYRLLHEYAPFPIALIPHDGSGVHANRALAELFGTTMSRLATLPVAKLFAPESADATLARLQNHLENPETIPFMECAARRFDGTDFVAKIHGHQLRDSAGLPSAFVIGIADISEALDQAAALTTSEAKLSALVNHSADIIAVLYPDGNWEASDAGTRHLGYPKGFDPEGGIFSLVHPEDLEQAATALGAVLEGTRGPDEPIELRLRSAEGTYWDYECVGQNLGDLGAIGGVVVTARNITPRKRTENALREAQERFRAAFEHAPLCLAILALDGILNDVNPAGCTMLGFSHDEIIGTEFDRFVHPDDRRDFADAIHCLLDGGKGRQFEHRLLNRDNDVVWTLTDAAVVNDEFGAPLHLIVMLADITERKASEALLSYGASHDVLTGLWNRSAFGDRLTHALARRTEPGSTALLFLDLDRFKMVNDTLGHQAGDAVLAEIAQRLHRTTREADTVARLGGDEFVVLCEDLDRPDEAMEIAERIASAVEAPIAIGNRTATVGASIGIAISDGIQSAEALMRNSDAAVYRAKHQGRSRVELFDAALRAAHSQRRTLEIGLRQALEHHAIDIEYAPIVGLIDRQIRGYQSVGSWTQPNGMVLQGPELRTNASDMGMATVLDRLLFTTGCLEAARWQTSDGPPVPLLHIELAAKHLDDQSLIKGLQSALIGTSLSPKRVCIEVPESWVVNDPQNALQTMRQLRETGVQLGLVEFGRSSSSFALLREIDVDFVKLSRQFYVDVGRDAAGQAIVRAVIALARKLQFGIIADGVEQVEEVRTLIQLECDFAQGPFFIPAPTA